MKALQTLNQLYGSIPSRYLEDWKGQNKPVVGYVCSYIPREILDAAGILPYRIGARGCSATSMADAVMSPITCSFARCCLELALKGDYGFLDGLVSMNSCENMRRMCDNWRYKVGTPFFHFISVPYKSNEDAIEWYREELHMFKKNLEQFFGITITDEKLQNSIRMNNETRRLLKKLYNTRRRKKPPLSGAESQQISVMANSMPIEEYNKLIARLLDEIDSKEGITNKRARLMIIGSCLDDSRYTELIEELGGLVVADASCFGTFSVWDQVQLVGDPLDSIARSYLNRVPCPRMPGKQLVRLNHIKEILDTFEVDGVIFERMVNCNLWGGETMSLVKDFQELDISLLTLDREYIPSGIGQLRTRVQAFLEMIAGV